MGDVNDGNALFTQSVDDTEQALGLALGQSGGGLVHDQDLGVRHQGLADLDHLLLADGQFTHNSIHGDADAHAVHDLLGLLAHGLAVDNAQALGDLLAHEEVFLHGQVKQGVDLLVDEDDARLLCLLGIFIAHFLAVHQHGTGITGVHAGEDLHQRGLTGAVFAHEGVNFAVVQDEAGVLQDLVGTEGLVNALHFNIHILAAPPFRRKCSRTAK